MSKLLDYAKKKREDRQKKIKENPSNKNLKAKNKKKVKLSREDFEAIARNMY